MPAVKDDITRYVSLLSEQEAESLAPLFRDALEGERFWERDTAVFFHQNAKARPVVVKRGVPSHQNHAPGPAHGEDFFVPIPVAKSVPHAQVVELPPPEEVHAPLEQVLATRRSRRSFTGAAITLRQLSTLLGRAAGVVGATEAYGFSALPRRPFPSSGGLGSPELYVCVQRVEGVEPGLYHYAPQRHALERMKDADPSSFIASRTFGQRFVEQGAVTLVVTGVYERLRWKYGERAYRYLGMDAGFMAQNVYLVGEAMGLGVCAIAGFYDDDVERFVGADGADEMVLLLMSVGVPEQE